MKAFFKVLLIILVFLFFFALYSYIFYNLTSGVFPESINGEFTMIFIYILGAIMAFIKLYAVNSYFEARLNKKK